MRTCPEFTKAAPTLLVLLFALTSSAHEGETHMAADMDMAKTTAGAGMPLAATPSNVTLEMPPSYFRHSEHSHLILAHIILMTISWVLRGGSKSSEEQLPFIQTMQQSGGGYQWANNIENAPGYRFSDDSGHGTEQNDESLRGNSSSLLEDDRDVMNSIDGKYYEVETDNLAHGSKGSRHALVRRLRAVLSSKVPLYVSSRVTVLLRILEVIITRTILIQGFVGLTTGAVTYAGIFRGRDVFSGLAHFIKGGVFFWYGIFTLGRWAGSFADRGWAWNIRPKTSSGKPEDASTISAEFVESSLIFFYGSTNIFLEHLNAWGEAWSAQDMEHISITIMFIGGGLCGMLIESTGIRNLLNINTPKASMSRPVDSQFMDGDDDESSWQAPKSYKFSMNPIPALMVLLLGIMMSSHHQSSMVSTMIHKQWGTLLMGASFARGLTYIIFYLSPPTSFLPSRPPSELITAFCLMAGGLVFMASSRDTVVAMEYNNLDAMFVFTVTMGLVSFLMAWIILNVAVKGWALQREKRHNRL
ncbi:hypothetical protein V493_05109 [Pseudogymnoascus sp. VKM F-4281 (FW-2241)]|nr:hypothetical protein V493_05109 [Pseudogymnoascus sp. VKM F-4281 (FW-2241)]